MEDEEENKRLYVPDIYVIDKGKIVDHDNTLSAVTGNVEDYLTEDMKKKLTKKLTNLVAKYTVKECETCN